MPVTRQASLGFRAKKKILLDHNIEKLKSPSCDRVSCEENEYVEKDIGKKRKSYKDDINDSLLLTPSTALSSLSIGTPRSALETKLSSVRKAFNSETLGLPCREDEINQLHEYLVTSLTDQTSGSMYISGLPGTGKTATLLQVLQRKEIVKGYNKIYINCTAVKSAGSIYLRICEALKIKLNSKTEKNALAGINRYLPRKHKMILLVLDEMDQLESRFQTVLYTMFEWPALKNPRLVLVGVANAVDLTDRLLPRLCASTIKPILLHFRPYTKDQIVTILRNRLAEAEGLVFAPGSLELISAKVAGQSGDLRRALDLARRVLDVTQSANNQVPNDATPKKCSLNSKTPTKIMGIENCSPLGPPKSPWRSPRKRGLITPKKLNMELGDLKNDKVKIDDIIEACSPRKSPRKCVREKDIECFSVRAKDVAHVVNLTYGSGRNMGGGSAFPLHQKVLVCSLLLILGKSRNKDVSVGKLHEIYSRVCQKRGITAVDQSGFIFLCRQVEMAGALLVGRGPPRLAKISLQWDEEEIAHAIQDSGLLAAICNDTSCLYNKKA